VTASAKCHQRRAPNARRSKATRLTGSRVTNSGRGSWCGRERARCGTDCAAPSRPSRTHRYVIRYRKGTTAKSGLLLSRGTLAATPRIGRVFARGRVARSERKRP
jgi:hypothetical protein